jgi:hypothetical protein
MSMNRRKTQAGVTLTGLLMTSIVVAMVALLGMKVVPEYIEYGKVMSNLKAIAGDASMKGASVGDVRAAFRRRADTSYIESVKAEDVDVSKDGNNLVLSVSYTRRIPLFGPVSLLIDFEGTTAR